jgi:hypothetical protein
MIKSEFYYGKPQSYWDDLLFQAEDLLREEELGVHLVGAYPIKPGDWGENDPSVPGITCLYIDSVESLINPCHSNKAYPFTCGPVRLIELYKWAVALIDNTAGDQDKNILSGDILHEDDGIAEIMEAAQALTDNCSLANKRALGQAVADLYRMLI